MNTARTALVVASCFCGLSGCGKGEEVYPVDGRVMVNGFPAGDASIAFYPRDKTQLRIPVARTATDGTFRLMTMRPGDGAPAGEYDVGVMWPDYSIPRDECADPLHDRLQLRYTDPTKSGFHATVRPGHNTFDFQPVMEINKGWSFPRLGDKGN